MSQSLSSGGTTNINSLPTNQPQQASPDYDNMYRQDNTPLVGASNPTASNYEGIDNMNSEPMAANAGGGGFGGAFGGW